MVEPTQNSRARTLVALIEGVGACIGMFGALAMKAPDNPVGWAWNICLPLMFGGLAGVAWTTGRTGDDLARCACSD